MTTPDDAAVRICAVLTHRLGFCEKFTEEKGVFSKALQTTASRFKALTGWDYRDSTKERLWRTSNNGTHRPSKKLAEHLVGEGDVPEVEDILLSRSYIFTLGEETLLRETRDGLFHTPPDRQETLFETVREQLRAPLREVPDPAAFFDPRIWRFDAMPIETRPSDDHEVFARLGLYRTMMRWQEQGMRQKHDMNPIRAAYVVVGQRKAKGVPPPKLSLPCSKKAGEDGVEAKVRELAQSMLG